MYIFITTLLFCNAILVSWGFSQRDNKKKNITIAILWIALTISLTTNRYLLCEDNKIAAYEIETGEPSIQTFSVPEIEVEVFEPVVTPMITPTLLPEQEPEEVKIEPRYEFTDNDIYLMARLLCGSKHKDGDGEYDFDYGNEDRLDQINVVLSVVMNRVQDKRFPDTVEEVITQRYRGQGYQFSAVALWRSDNKEVSEIAIKRVTDWCYAYNNRLKGVLVIPEDYVYFSSYGKGVNIPRRDL